MSLIRRWLLDRSGGAAVEFSAVILTMFTLLFGVTEFGWYMWTANALQQTAIQSARCMGVVATNCASGAAYSSTNTLSYVQSVASTYGVTVPTAGVTLSRAATCGGASVGGGTGQCLELIGTQVSLSGGTAAASNCVSGGGGNVKIALVQ